MATYQEIIKKINDITDNGNNRASKVREILTDLLNFNNNGFEIATPNIIINENIGYFYSFKGIKEQCCNMFLYLGSSQKNSESQQHLSEISQQEFTILKNFIPVYGSDNNFLSPLSFNMPVNGTRNSTNVLIYLINNKNDKFHIVILSYLAFEQYIFTTIPLNFKKIVMPKDGKMKNKIFENALKANMKSKDFLDLNLDKIK